MYRISPFAVRPTAGDLLKLPAKGGSGRHWKETYAPRGREWESNTECDPGISGILSASGVCSKHGFEHRPDFGVERRLPATTARFV
jgi:hypothetical protein